MENIKKEKNLNVRLKAMGFDEAICEAEHNCSYTDTDKSSSNDGNLHILKISEQFSDFVLLYF